MNIEVEDEFVETGARVARVLTAAGMRLVEQLNRQAAEHSRRLAEGHREAASVLEQQKRSQHYAMQMIVKPALSEAWCQRAGERDLATAFVFAEAWKERDTVAEVAYKNLAAEIAGRGVDLTKFVDGNVPAHTVEVMPEPSTDVTSEEEAQVAQNMAQLRQQATESGQELPDIARTDPRMFAITQVLSKEQKRQIANLAETSGQDFAIQTFENYLSPDQRAKMVAWEEIARAEQEKADAEQERANAENPNSASENLEHDSKSSVDADTLAARLDARGQARESFAEQELMGYGQFRDVPGEVSDAQLAKIDIEAANARKISRPGRTQPLISALKNASPRNSSGKAKPAHRAMERESGQERH